MPERVHGSGGERTRLGSRGVHVAWIAAVLVGAAVVFVAREQDDVDADHARGIAAEREQAARLRPGARARLTAIRAELARGEAPSWAGEYGWSSEGWRDSVGWHGGEHVVLAPGAGAVWWFGAADLEGATHVDEGPVTSADDERVLVAWSGNAREPQRSFRASWIPLLDAELARVRVDGEDALVPAGRLGLLGAPSACDSRYPPLCVPRRGGSVLAADPSRRTPLAWDVPARYEPYRHPTVIASRAVVLDEATRRRERTVTTSSASLWERLVGAGSGTQFHVVRSTLRLGQGTAEGVRVGQVLVTPAGALVWVTEAGEHHAILACDHGGAWEPAGRAEIGVYTDPRAASRDEAEGAGGARRRVTSPSGRSRPSSN